MSSPAAHPPHPHPQPQSARALAVVTLAALGIVYGDIGTSPLYALRECFHGPHAIEVSRGNVLGVLSLIFWSLIVVISIKYLIFVMRADNQGEGGILALMALVPADYRSAQSRGVLVALGLFGAALLYGDGMITPAISVLGAMEGLTTATPALAPFVVPLTVGVLVALFLLQSRGTARVGAIFGPVMVVWFVTIGALGTRAILGDPHVLVAANPRYAVDFFARNGFHGFIVLGSVFLVVTGGEALYADMGHFGKRPIRVAWFSLVQPALMLNYFGQGALLLADPRAAAQPFYLLAPQALLYPLIALATLAAVIASQALISAVFSLTRQAVQLGYSPRMAIRYTSAETMGQVYIPQMNWALMIATIGIVVTFRSSSALAAAYGIAVTMTMGITTVLAYVVSRQVWGWSRLAAGAAAFTFIVADLAFFGANALKIAHGGWVPLVIALIGFLIMTTWKRGREIVGERLRARAYPFADFVKDITVNPPHRVAGTAVFLTGDPTGAPTALLHNLKHNKIIHERNIVMTIRTEPTPRHPVEDRVKIEQVSPSFHRVVVSFGFMETPNLLKGLAACKRQGLPFEIMSTSFFLSRHSLKASAKSGMPLWQDRLFITLAGTADSATDYFHIPAERVVEIGAQITV